MTPLDRRIVLTTQANPSPTTDYVVTLDGNVAGCELRLIYVPDRLVLESSAFTRYMTMITALPWPSLEALGVVVRDDINDVLVPRWLRVTLGQRHEGVVHSLRLEDRQPRWANDRLLVDL